MKRAVLYIHGKDGSPEEARQYAHLFPGCTVTGLAYTAQTPWQAREEFPRLFADASRGCDEVTVIANSIGAFFAMHALGAEKIHRACFISPIVDMERLILTMMTWAKVTEEELCRRGEIPTTFGETLSWDYLCYVRQHPLVWPHPTHILYGAQDNLTDYETIAVFAERHRATLTVMPGGEHWFHTDQQMAFLLNWLKGVL